MFRVPRPLLPPPPFLLNTPAMHAAPERKLLTILAADVVGYSALMGRDEPGTLRQLNTSRVLMAEAIAEHRGRVFNTAGDSLLADFPASSTPSSAPSGCSAAWRSAMRRCRKRRGCASASGSISTTCWWRGDTKAR